ncbi:MAG TPA: LemA family protein [Vitreimonas sp.]|uniref:LemA family protein n=1 Tax=Vitreimonas sp. TaxID=3069702 RepID=UPI002D39568E|nr:LemA family protein [Vitreimonas sp.]HYD88628.1 LemA family protein [Vitreimonas sp.]
MTAIIFLAVAAIVLIAAIVLYNGLIAKRQMAQNGWSDIDVQLKRRADLIPQLVTTVKAYAAHEKQLFEDVAARRAAALAAGDDVTTRSAAESELSRPVARLIAVAEAYPELKASQNFLDLQNELSATEDKIEMARRFYNGAVRELNTAVETVPGNIVAALGGVKARQYFEIESANRAAPALHLGGGA